MKIDNILDAMTSLVLQLQQSASNISQVTRSVLMHRLLNLKA